MGPAAPSGRLWGPHRVGPVAVPRAPSGWGPGGRNLEGSPPPPRNERGDPAPSAALQEAFHRFREAFEADRRAGPVPPVEAYLARFPGHAAEVREWYARFADGEDATPVRPPPTASVLGRLLAADGGRYASGGEIARGGMGIILRVRESILDRDLAMKVLPGDEGRLARDPADPTATVVPSPSLRRFLQEAHVTAQLAHPGVPPVHALGVDGDGRVFFTMKFVRGRTLSELFERVRAGAEGWTVTRALQVFLRICETMAFAHSRGVIHRDLKPPNIMVGNFGEVYVMDWGLAKTRSAGDGDASGEMAAAGGPGSDGSGAWDADGLTLAGSVLGTPFYMSPEQAAGHHHALDSRSDVYSIGAMLYELVAGVPPYREPGEPTPHPLVVVAAVREGPPRSLHSVNARAPAELEAIVARAMARAPGDRYPSAAELAEDLHRYLDGRVVRAHRTGPLVELRKWVLRHRGEAAGAAAVVALTVLGAVVLAARERASAVDIAAQRDAAISARDAEGLARRAAERERRRAEGSTLCARSFTLADRDPTLAMQLAVAGAAWAPGGEANEALLAALHGQREVRRLYGHDSYVYGVAWSPDGTGLLSWQWGRLVILWDPVSGSVRHRLDDHGSVVTGASWNPAGDRVVTTSTDGRTRIWDAASGTCLHVLEGHEGPVVMARHDAAGSRLLTASEDRTARLWDTGTGECLRVLRGHGAGVWSVDFHPDGRRALTTGPDRTARVWDLASGEEVLRVETHASAAAGSRYSSSGGRSIHWHDTAFFVAGGETFVTWHRISASRGNHGEARLFGTEGGLERGRAGDGATRVRAPVAVAGGASLILAAAGDGPSEAEYRDARTFAVQRRIPDIRGTQGFAASGDGRFLAGAGLWEGRVTLVDTSAPDRVTLLPHAYAAAGVDFHPDGSRVATAACDRTVRIWWTADPDLARGLEGRTAWPSADGSCGWRSDRDGKGLHTVVRGLDGRTGAETWRRDLDPPAHYVTDASRRGLVVVVQADTLRVLDVKTGEERRRVEGLDWRGVPAMKGFSVGPGARRLVHRTAEGFVAVDLEQARVLHTGRIAPGLDVHRIGWDAAGRRIVIANNADRLATVWEVDSGRELARLRGHTGHVVDAVLTPDGQRAVTVAVDRSVQVWEVATGRMLAANRTIPMEECDLDMHPDGALVSLLGTQAGLLLLDTTNLEPAARIAPEILRSSAAWFDPGGEWILSRHGSGTIRRWPVDPLPLARARLPCGMEPAVSRQMAFGTPAEFEAQELEWLRRHPEPERLARKALERIASGDLDDARRWIDAALAARRRHALPHHALACWHAARGETAAALDALEEAARHEGSLPRPLEDDPRFASLRGESRFRSLVERASAER